MNIHNANIHVSVIILSAGILACTLSVPPSAPPDSGPTPPPVIEPTATVESALPPTSSGAGIVEITELNPCGLVTKEYVETVLGYSVDDPTLAQETTFSMCTYIVKPGEFVTITIYEEDHAKSNFLNEIAQFQQGCSLSYRATTRDETPTPLPPDVEALRSESIPELFLKNREMRKGCGGSHSQISELGSNVYALQQTGLNAAGIGIVTENVYVQYSLFITDMSAEQALETVTELVKLSIAK